MGDAIIKSKSHQSVLNDLLNDFSTGKGLRVKTFKKGMSNVFPGGVEYHNNKAYMKAVVEGKKRFLIFHMSWTQNKDNKIKYFQQLGEWYTTGPEDGMTAASDCSGLDCYCLSEPNITCHYSDKPSKIPCRSSPAVVEGRGRSFW
jgi:hypothetical protein